MKIPKNPQWSIYQERKSRAVFTVYIIRLTLRICTPCTPCPMHSKEQQEGDTCHVTVPSARPAAGITKTMECSPLGSVYWVKTSRGVPGRAANSCSVSSVNCIGVMVLTKNHSFSSKPCYYCPPFDGLCEIPVVFSVRIFQIFRKW